MRSWLTLGALFIVVAALGLWVYKRPPSNAEGAHALSALKASEVKRIRLSRPAASAASSDATAALEVVLERDHDAWRMVSPIHARTQPFQVERLTSILSAQSAARLPPTELARFELDKPSATLTLGDQTFAFGGVNTTTREQYVLTAGAVYVVPLAYIAALPRSADALLALEILGRNEEPARFELPDFSVALENGAWRVTPGSLEASADERAAWVDGWRHATAIRAERSAQRPPQKLTVTLRDGRTIPIAIVRREPELVLVREDEGIEYHFFAENGKRLLAAPGAAIEHPTR